MGVVVVGCANNVRRIVVAPCVVLCYLEVEKRFIKVS